MQAARFAPSIYRPGQLLHNFFFFLFLFLFVMNLVLVLELQISATAEFETCKL